MHASGQESFGRPDVKSIRDAVEQMRARGGKRLRSRLCRAVFECAGAGRAVDLAPLEAALEEVHDATLVHDDIQDGDRTRNGRPSVWAACGVPVAVAVGDWLLASACQRVADSAFSRRDAMTRLFAATLRRLSEGQADELLGRGDYAQICADKTGALFALAASFGALAAEADPAPYAAWAERFGVYFQIVDDCRDEGATAARAALRGAVGAELAAQPLTARFAEWIRTAGFDPADERRILDFPQQPKGK